MATHTRLPVIDADAHVIETERTWDYLEPSEQQFRPLLCASPQDPTRQYWVIEDKIRGFRFPTLTEQQLRTLSQRSGRNVETPQAARELDDVQLRLQHMDALGIDIQVLHNTLWIEQVAQRPDVEAALCRSWNRWLGEVWQQSQGRLRWSCVVPTLLLDEAIVQMRAAQAHGAVAVCMRPLEGERCMTDPYFYPIYDEASRLDMAIAVHIANGNPANCELLRYFPGSQRLNGFALFQAPTVLACFLLLMSELPHVFPQLRWGFIEASAQWVPWIHNEAARRYEAEGKRLPADVFFPCYSQIPPGTLATNRGVRAWVPMDDEHTMFFGMSAPPAGGVVTAPERSRRQTTRGGNVRPTQSQGGFVSGTEMRPDTTDWYGRSRPKPNASNDYLLDREKVRTGDSYTGLPSVVMEDQAITESMGPIYDRSQEHLGTSDSMVIRTRRRLIQAALALRDQGTVPPGVDNPEFYRQRSGGVILPRSVDWVEATQELRKAFIEYPEEFVLETIGAPSSSRRV